MPKVWQPSTVDPACESGEMGATGQETDQGCGVIMWEDRSRYKKGEDRNIPKSFRYIEGIIVIQLILADGLWMARINENTKFAKRDLRWFELKTKNTKDPEEAKAEALVAARDAVIKTLNKLDKDIKPYEFGQLTATFC